MPRPALCTVPPLLRPCRHRAVLMRTVCAALYCTAVCCCRYVCPITLAVMDEPVLASDGNCYERRCGQCTGGGGGAEGGARAHIPRGGGRELAGGAQHACKNAVRAPIKRWWPMRWRRRRPRDLCTSPPSPPSPPCSALEMWLELGNDEFPGSGIKIQDRTFQ